MKPEVTETTIIRIEEREQWTIITKDIGEDSTLSLAAKGMMLHLLGKPDNWVVRVDDLVNRSTDSKYVVRKTLNELIKRGYLSRIQERDEAGRVTPVSYIVREKPRSEQITPACEIRKAASEQIAPLFDPPHAVNRTLDNNKIRKESIVTENSSPEELSPEAEPHQENKANPAKRLEAVGVNAEVAAEIADQHDGTSIFWAIKNGELEAEVREHTGTPFDLPGYVVATLNTAFREGHPVKPSRRFFKLNRTEEKQRLDKAAGKRRFLQDIQELKAGA